LVCVGYLAHFGHANIIKYSSRPFSSVEEHDETLIENWNKHVKDNEDVYFLGDFAYRNKNAAANIRRRLNGNIYFIEGNHDKSAFQIRNTFEWYKQTHEIKVEGHRIWLSHYAHRTWNKSHHGAIHLYGHSHHSLPDDPHALSMDVGVDAIACRAANVKSGTNPIPVGKTKPEDYRPISLDEVINFMSDKNWFPIDHHGRKPNMS
jgi:calcineurin-like phosphoesterase family protein